MANKTSWIQIDAYLMWAKVFEQNRDTAEAAKAKGVTHKGVIKGLEATEGKYTVNVVPATEADLTKVKEATTEFMYGGRKRFADVDVDFGTKVSFELERKHLNKVTFDTKEGPKEFDFGGAPEIVWFNEDKGYNTKYSLEEDGFIGNGTLAKVKFSIYGGENPETSDTIRLEKIGIVNLVKFESSNNDDGVRF